MKKKFIFFLSQPIDERNIDRLGFKYLNKSYNCEIWDISLIFNRRIAKYQKKKNYNNKNLFLIKNKTEFFLKILKLNNFYFIDLSTYNSFFYLLVQILAANKGIKISITGLNLPQTIFISKKKKFYNIFFSYKFFSIINLFLNFLKNKLINFLTPISKILFYAGKKDPKLLLPCKYKIQSHSIDFDYYLKAKKKNKQNKNGIVFLDQAYGDHPEYYLSFGKKSKILDLYLSELHIFLCKISNIYNNKIIIALHPRATKKYEKKIKNKFTQKNFYITKNSSASYINSSNFVICHMSSSHQIAVLNYKAIIFSYSKLFNNRETHYVKSLANSLNLNAVQMNQKNLNLNLDIDKKKYKEYINNYITTNKKSKKISWKIITSSLKKIKIYE